MFAAKFTADSWIHHRWTHWWGLCGDENGTGQLQEEKAGIVAGSQADSTGQKALFFPTWALDGSSGSRLKGAKSRNSSIWGIARTGNAWAGLVAGWDLAVPLCQETKCQVAPAQTDGNLLQWERKEKNFLFSIKTKITSKNITLT